MISLDLFNESEEIIMYDFDAYEAVDELIDEINDEYAVEAAEEAYQKIYEELCERVDYGELTLEDAEIINEAAAEKYLYEDGEESSEDDETSEKDKKSKKKKKKHSKKKIAAGVASGIAIRTGALYGLNALNAREAYRRFEKDKKNTAADDPIGDLTKDFARSMQCAVRKKTNRLGKHLISKDIKSKRK